MKTSNKILLGTFLTALLILASMHIALYAKFKNGEYTLVSDDWHPNLASFSLDDVKHVSLDNIENVTLHFSDSSRLRYDKPGENEENILSVSKKNDTLFVVGKSKKANVGRWYKQTDLYLASNIEVKAINSQLHFGSGSAKAATNSINLSLDRALVDMNRGEIVSRLDDVRISAVNRSTVMLNNVSIKRLNSFLDKSFLEGNNLTADSITINSDAASQIKLSAQNLSKAKLTVHE